MVVAACRRTTARPRASTSSPPIRETPSRRSISAFFYEKGRGGLPKDDREAARLYKLAADQGNAAAQNNLGVFYENGRGGLPKDDREAARLYKLAADQGNAAAQNNLGIFYEQGRGGLPKDDREAARLYKLAADQGDAVAQNNLGIFYERGRGGLPQDDREAAKSSFPRRLKSWLYCPHGVLAGKYGDRCETCVREQAEIAETRRQEQELRERQQRIEQELRDREQRIEHERQVRRRRIDSAAEMLRDSERMRLESSLVPSIEELRGLSWQQFEDEVAHMFERLGFIVEQTPYVNDHGRDAILWKDGKKYLLECKRYGEEGLSSRPDLQRFYGVITHDAAVSGYFVTTGRFTKDAIEFGATVPIELIDQNNLLRTMFDSKPDPAEGLNSFVDVPTMRGYCFSPFADAPIDKMPEWARCCAHPSKF